MNVCFPRGVIANGVSSGIKPNGALDCAVVVSESDAAAASVFTTNRAAAAPVEVSRENLLASRGVARALILTSGNANAATGEDGRQSVRVLCETAAAFLGCSSEHVLVAQTGLIGIPFDPGPTASTLALAFGSAVGAGEDSGAKKAALAILTTDTVPKETQAVVHTSKGEIRIGAMAKGAAMLAPSMATMLAAITSDARLAPEDLHFALQAAVDMSFNNVLVDEMSTNDTVFAMATGASGVDLAAGSNDYLEFCAALGQACTNLALMMAKDAEGATKFFSVHVSGARTPKDARMAARAVARSLLVKASLAGNDPYWGRVLAQVGASGADFNPEDVSISYGGFKVCAGGVANRADGADRPDPEALAEYMTQREIEIKIDLDCGTGSAVNYGSDLTHAYLDENMGTS